ncbi:hybrid sensor histidine kinase/response regulator, partial [Pseudoxanthomonas sp. SGD-10]
MLLSRLTRYFTRRTFSVFFTIFTLSTLFLHFADAQELRVKRINNESGLSNSTIECIFQDKRGFIWIGTRDGLNKYDGYNITSYKNLPNNLQSISDSYITCIFEDSQETLWIGTKSGLNIFDQKTGLFKRIAIGERGKEAISKIVEITPGNMIVATTDNGLFCLTTTAKQVTSNNRLVGFEGNKIYDLHISSDRTLWASTSSGLFKLVLKNRRFHAKRILNKPTNIIISDSNNFLWLGTEDDGIIRYSLSDETLKYFRYNHLSDNTIRSNQIKALLIDKDNALWIGTINGGLNKLDIDTYTFSNYTNNPNNSNGLSQRTISALFEDRQGNIWIGTHRGGINVYSPFAEKFNLQTQSSEKNGLNYNDIKSF